MDDFTDIFAFGRRLDFLQASRIWVCALGTEASTPHRAIWANKTECMVLGVHCDGSRICRRIHICHHVCRLNSFAVSLLQRTTVFENERVGRVCEGCSFSFFDRVSDFSSSFKSFLVTIKRFAIISSNWNDVFRCVFIEVNHQILLSGRDFLDKGRVIMLTYCWVSLCNVFDLLTINTTCQKSLEF